MKWGPFDKWAGERGKNLGHSDSEGFKRTKVQKKEGFIGPLLTAMAQVPPFLIDKWAVFLLGN